MKHFFICYATLLFCCSSYSMASQRQIARQELFHTAHITTKFMARYNAYTQFAHRLHNEISIAEEADPEYLDPQLHNYRLLRLKKLEKYLERIKAEHLIKFFNPPHKKSPPYIGSLLQNILTQQERTKNTLTLPEQFNIIDKATVEELEKLKNDILCEKLTLEYKALIKEQLQHVFNSYAPITPATEQPSAILSKSVDSLQKSESLKYLKSIKQKELQHICTSCASTTKQSCNILSKSADSVTNL